MTEASALIVFFNLMSQSQYDGDKTCSIIRISGEKMATVRGWVMMLQSQQSSTIYSYTNQRVSRSLETLCNIRCITDTLEEMWGSVPICVSWSGLLMGRGRTYIKPFLFSLHFSLLLKCWWRPYKFESWATPSLPQGHTLKQLLKNANNNHDL